VSSVEPSSTTRHSCGGSLWAYTESRARGRQAARVGVGMTAKNRFAAPPVLLTRERLKSPGKLSGIVVNSGNANAATGAEGLRHARAMARAAEGVTGMPAGSFLVSSTGVIGQPMKIERVTRGISRLAEKLSPNGWDDFATSIMTTDLVKKVSSRKIPLPGGGQATVAGMAKGSGMIQPNMATMLAFIATDFPLSASSAKSLLRESVEVSFHCLTVDGQSSTIDVRGAATRKDCRTLALEVGNSPLVKTALHGGDPNWGRIAQALGKAEVDFDPARVSIWCQGVKIMNRGGAIRFSRPGLRRKMQGRDIHIEVEIGKAPTSIRVWTCDFGYGYIDINTAYN